MIKVLGLDVAKPLFRIYGIDELGKVVVERDIKLSEMPTYFGNLNKCRIGIAVDDMHSSLARHWAKKLEGYNHRVTLMSFEFVSSFAIEHNLESVDAESICKALAQL